MLTSVQERADFSRSISMRKLARALTAAATSTITIFGLPGVTPVQAETEGHYFDNPVEYEISDSDALQLVDGSVSLVRSPFETSAVTSNDIAGDVGRSTTAPAGDVDGDGDLDIYVAVHSGPNRLWINDGSGGFTAKDIAGDVGHGYGAAMGDVDNDGDLDIYTANVNGRGGVSLQNKLWINDGSANFTASDIPGDDASSPHATMADIDSDGDLDIYTTSFKAGSNRLWINQGGAQSGAIATFLASDIPGDTQKGYGSFAGDIDGDGDLDIYSPSLRSGPNKLWINDGLGNGGTSFTASDIVGDAGSYSYWSQMGDVDNDGDLDIYVANSDGQNNLWTNDGLGNGGTSFTANDIPGDVGHDIGASMVDLDGDGDLDIHVPVYGGQNRIWFNNGTGTFEADQIEGDLGVSVRSTIADFDGNGILDIYTTNWEEQSKLWLSRDPYSSEKPYITPTTAIAYPARLASFTETLGDNNQGTPTYQVSSDAGTTWKYWDGSKWQPTSLTDGNETSLGVDIASNIGSLDTDGGDFLWRAYLVSDGTEQVEIDDIVVTYFEPEVDTVDDSDGVADGVEDSAPNGDGDELVSTQPVIASPPTLAFTGISTPIYISVGLVLIALGVTFTRRSRFPHRRTSLSRGGH